MIITRSLTHSRFYKAVAIVLSVALVGSSIPLQGWSILFGAGIAHAAPVETGSISLLPSGVDSPLVQAMQAALPSELTNQLNGTGMLAPGGHPNGMLMDVGALQAMMQQEEPVSLADPISISRMQSAYAVPNTTSSMLAITFTVTNNRPPIIVPEIPVTATITQTVFAALAMDFANDPNVVHNVLVVDGLLPASTKFIFAEPMPDRDGDSLAWSLGDVPPLGGVTVTLVVSVPTSVITFTELDTGAAAWGILQGRAVSASTAPAVLAPDNLGQWLVWTVDADYYDEYMVREIAELGNGWQQMFAYVRSLGYESYKGSLRGTRGTLWSEAGNSLDQASLLIAMLRSSGIPARYRHGELSTNRVQELILSMFPKPARVIGHVPAGTRVSDPANDPQLLAETRDHWWVEAYLPGQGWTDLDPCFADALPGQTFHTSLAADGTDQIAEVPDNLRHKVTLTVKVERYHPLTPQQSGLSYVYPLSYTFNTVELVGNPVALEHLVNTDYGGGAAFYDLQHTYVPYFAVNDFETVIEGTPFQELKSNFPFGNFLVTGEWLLFDVTQRVALDIFDKRGRIPPDQVGGLTDGEAIQHDTSIILPGLVTARQVAVYPPPEHLSYISKQGFSPRALLPGDWEARDLRHSVALALPGVFALVSLGDECPIYHSPSRAGREGHSSFDVCHSSPITIGGSTNVIWP